MPVFELQHDDGRTFQVEAPDMETASQSLKYATTQLGAFARGLASGVTAGFSDELAGVKAASGLPKLPIVGGDVISTIAGAGRLGYEKLRGEDGEATKRYETVRDQERARDKAAREEYPKTFIAGEVGGALALPGGVAARGATLPIRMARGATVGAGYGALTGVGEGEGTADSVSRGVTGAAIGGLGGAVAAPVVEGLVRGAGAATAPVVNALRGAVRPDDEAARRVVTAIERDIATDPAAESRLTPQEFTASRQQPGGGPAAIMDLGGDMTRALARSAANTSPEGRQALNSVIDERFEGQTGRVTNWLRDTFNYPDAHAQQQALDQTGRTVNRVAYAKAYRDGDQGLWSPELERLASSPDVVAAMKDAATKGKSRAVTQGFGGFNPGVTVDQSGNVSFATGKNGVPTYPNLQFWDYAKRALDDSASAARRSGRNEEASTLGTLSRQLRGELDRLVPSYAQARAGAAHFFGAENALEAGQNFVTARMGNSQARDALARMTPQERQLFQDGFVSRFIETLNETGDRRNVLNQIASSPAARERLMMVLGRQRSTELEAGLRVEGIMDLARSAVQGNSTTARQLAELGLAGGAGALSSYGAYSMDPREIAVGAVMGALLAGGRHIDQRVARRVAQMLASDDPAILRRGLRVVTGNNQFMDALRAADRRLASVGGEQSGNVPALEAMGVGRTDQNKQDVPRPAAQ